MFSGAVSDLYLQKATWRFTFHTSAMLPYFVVEKVPICTTFTNGWREYRAIFDLFSIAFQAIGICITSAIK